MNKFIKNVNTLSFVILFIAACVLNSAAQVKNAEIKNLEKIRTEIEKLQEDYTKASNSEKNAINSIKSIDKEIRIYENLLSKLEKKEKQLNGSMNSNMRQINSLRTSLKSIKNDYGQRAVNYYKYGRESSLESVLTGGGASKSAALQKYYKVLASRDRESFLDIKKKINNMSVANSSLLSDIKKQKSNIKSKEKETNVLKNKKVQGSALLNTVRESKVLIAKSLEEKKNAEKYLISEINILTKKAGSSTNIELVNSFPKFSNLKGRLEWPTNGIIVSRMGVNTIQKVKTEDRGIEISASRQAVVRSVEKGRVSMIKWIPWYGQTIFIQHSEGYFTVYSRVEGVSVKLNDIVDRNQKLGLTELDPATKDYKLSFQVWKNSRNLDPETWLKKKSGIIAGQISAPRKNSQKN